MAGRFGMRRRFTAVMCMSFEINSVASHRRNRLWARCGEASAVLAEEGAVIHLDEISIAGADEGIIKGDEAMVGEV